MTHLSFWCLLPLTHTSAHVFSTTIRPSFLAHPQPNKALFYRSLSQLMTPITSQHWREEVQTKIGKISRLACKTKVVFENPDVLLLFEVVLFIFLSFS
jgi:hypothetical protein